MPKDVKNIKVFISRDLPEIAVDLLRKAGFSVAAWAQERVMTPAELAGEAMKHTVLLCTVSDRIDKSLLAECPHLKMISQFGVGYDNINVAEATRRGIVVTNTPGAMSDATADIAFGLMLAVARKMFYLNRGIIQGDWGYFKPKANLGVELKNKTLGIFGLGRIGIEMAKRCMGAYEMKVIYHNRKPNVPAEKLLGAKYVSFDDLLKQSDVLSVHSVLSEETKGIFNKVAFGKMKHSAIFINTARGLVHNEEDLSAALMAGEIWGAGLDVTNPEPMKPDNPLLLMENVAILPHVGSGTIEARTEMARLAAINIIEFYKNGNVTHVVNPNVIQKVGNRQ